MLPNEPQDPGETAGAAAAIVIFIAIYATGLLGFGVVLTLALGWLPAALGAIAAARIVRSAFRVLTDAKVPVVPRRP